MAFSRVQGNAAEDDNPAATMPVAVSAVGSGNAVFGLVTWDDSTGINLTGVSDNSSNAYNTAAAILNTDNNQKMCLFWRTNITGGPTQITANFDSGASFKAILVDEWAGASTASADESAGNTGQLQLTPGTGTDGVTSGSILPSANNCLIWGVTTHGGGGIGVTVGTGFTISQDSTTAAEIESEYLVQGTASSVAATFTKAVNDTMVTYVLAIKPAVSAFTWLDMNKDNSTMPKSLFMRDIRAHD